MHTHYAIQAFWDDQASVWVASSDVVPGLSTEAETMESLIDKLKIMVPELLLENGLVDSAHQAVPFDVISHIHHSDAHPIN